MMDAGGDQKRKELLAKVNAKVFTAAFDSISLQPGDANFTAEEAKVAKFGDLGQGENLTGAKQKAQTTKPKK